ncbi:MAG: hypothetical protein R3279_07525 [Putridiphycobacter sp.]|nr:hypothetical protein [Putridiphycobacter sp.]
MNIYRIITPGTIHYIAAENDEEMRIMRYRHKVIPVQGCKIISPKDYKYHTLKVIDKYSPEDSFTHGTEIETTLDKIAFKITGNMYISNGLI